MNVLFATSDCQIVSGAFRSSVKLAIELTRLGNRCVVVVPYSGDGLELLEESGLKYYIVNSWSWVRSLEDKKFSSLMKAKAKSLSNKVAIRRIVDICKVESIEYIHVCTSHTYVAAVAAFKLGLPLIWHIREFLEEDQRLTFWDKRIALETMKQSTVIITVSESLRDKYKRLLPEARILTIYNGIDKNAFYVKRADVMKTERVRMIIVGGLQDGKGQRDLIEALAKVKMKYGNLNFTLKIIGRVDEPPSTYQKELANRIIDLGLSDNISICGQVSNPELSYRDSDICFMCSKNEAFGRVTVEAMLSGCVVIGADSMGTTEILEHNNTGFLYKNGNIEELANIIIYVCENKEHSVQIARNGQLFALKHFTADQNARQINSVYKSIELHRR